MKKTIIALLLIISSIKTIYAQSKEKAYTDTTFTTCFINGCEGTTVVPKNIAAYVTSNTPSTMEVKMKYKGSCTINDIEYKCVRIYEAKITIRVYKFNNHKIKRTWQRNWKEKWRTSRTNYLKPR